MFLAKVEKYSVQGRKVKKYGNLKMIQDVFKRDNWCGVRLIYQMRREQKSDGCQKEIKYSLK